MQNQVSRLHLAPAHPPPNRGQKILLIVGLIWALAVVMPDVYRLWGNLAAFDFQADNDGLIYSVGASADPKIRAGDRIQLQPGACWHSFAPPCRNMMAIFGGMGGLSYVLPGTITSLPIRRGAGPAKMTTFQATKAPLEPYAKVGLALDELFALIVLVMAFCLAWQRPGPMTIGFFLYVMWFNPGQYFTTYAWLQQYPAALIAQEVLQALAQGVGYAGFLVFAARFPHDVWEARLPWIERCALFVGIVLVALQLASFTNVLGFATEWITRCAILSGYIVACMAGLVGWYRLRLLPPADYQRMLWVLSGCGIGLTTFIFADSNEATSIWARDIWPGLGIHHPPTETIFEYCYLLSGLTAIFICIAVRRRRIVNVAIELQALLVSALVLIAGAIFEDWLKFPVSRIMKDLGMGADIQFAASTIVLLAMGLTVHQLAHAAPHLFNRRFYHAAHHLEALGKNALDAPSPEALDNMLVNGPPGCLDLSSAAVLRQSKGSFEPVAASANLAAQPISTLVPCWSADLLGKLKHGTTILLPLQHSKSEDEEDSQPAVALPIKFAGELYAVALFGAHPSGADLDRLEIKTLEKFAADLAISYERVHVRQLESENAMLRLQLIEAGLGVA